MVLPAGPGGGKKANHVVDSDRIWYLLYVFSIPSSGFSFTFWELVSFTGRQLAALLEYVAIFGLVWGQLMWIPNVRVSCRVEFSV